MATPGSIAQSSTWASPQLDVIWSQLEQQITPFTTVVSIADDLFTMLDDGAKQFLANRFMLHVYERVMFCRDGTRPDRWFLGAPRHFLSQGGTILLVDGAVPCWTVPDKNRIQTAQLGAPLVKDKPAKIPRPPNAYIIYRKERHQLVKDSHPGITNNQISQVLGKAWNMETREVRQAYKRKADELKQELLDRFPDYQYKPRKPHEKKKRRRRASPTLPDTPSSLVQAGEEETQGSLITSAN